MTKSGGSSSLRDVLLRSTSSKGDTGGTGKGREGEGPLTWRTLRSWGAADRTPPPRRAQFPSRLALILGIFKVILAILMVGGGSLAMVVRAALSSLGAGVWSGTVVGVSGFLGICAARRPYAHVYVVSFMCVSIMSMASSGLLVILSATAWSRDAEGPRAIYIQEDGGGSSVGGEVSSMVAGLMLKRPSVMVSGVLVLLGVIDCLVSLACATITAREACGLYSSTPRRTAPGLSEGHNRKERLYNWLGQQKTIFPTGHGGRVSSVSQFVPLSSSDSASSATPRRSTKETLGTASSLSTNVKHQVHPTKHASLPPPSQSSQPSQQIHQVLQQSANPHPPSQHPSVHDQPSQHKVQAPAPSQHSVYPPHSLQSVHMSSGSHSLLAPSALLPYQSPHPHHSLPAMMPVQYPYPSHPQSLSPPHSAHPSLYYPHFITPMMPHFPTEQGLQRHHQSKKRKKSSKKKKEGKKKHKKKELTDEQIERSYTGLDREIADSFIDNAMEPGISINRAFNSSFEQDSF